MDNYYYCSLAVLLSTYVKNNMVMAGFSKKKEIATMSFVDLTRDVYDQAQKIQVHKNHSPTNTIH